MRVAFYYDSIGGYEHLGVSSLSAILKKSGHQVGLFMKKGNYLNDYLMIHPSFNRIYNENNHTQKIINNVKAFNPHIICYSVLSENYASSIKFARLFKQHIDKHLINIFGGIHATSVPDTIIGENTVDYVIRGEGEFALLQLIEALRGERTFENVQNLVYQKNGKKIKNRMAPYLRDLDLLPIPDKDLFYEKIPALSKDYYIMAGRGCPFECTYCCNSLFHQTYNFEKNHIRRRSIEHVINELVIAKEKYRPKTISFLDEIFIYHKKKWLYPFLEEYKRKIGLPYYCQLHPEQIDPELAHQLSKSNCWNVTMGVQSGSSRIRENIYKRKTTNANIIQACRTIKKNNIFLTLDIILGCPTEGEKDLDLTNDIMDRIVPNRIACFFLAYYPGTEITKKARETKFIPMDIENAYIDGTLGATHYALKLPGEFALPLEKRKYWLCQAKLQILCILRNVKIAHLFYRVIERMSIRILPTFSKILTVLASLINFDKRGYQRIRVLISRKRLP